MVIWARARAPKAGAVSYQETKAMNQPNLVEVSLNKILKTKHSYPKLSQNSRERKDRH